MLLHPSGNVSHASVVGGNLKNSKSDGRVRRDADSAQVESGRACV